MKLLFAGAVLVLLLGCRRAQQEPAHLLGDYARRHGIPESVLDEQGDAWPQYIYDYSVGHGPNLTRREMEEYRSWKGE